jgi:uncharacterized membrane protein YfcA
MTIGIMIFFITFFAALVQTTTGLGFGMIVAPFLLVFYPPIDAIQITGALTLLIAAVMTPFGFKNIVKEELKNLAFGSAVGLILGTILLKFVPISSITISAFIVLSYAFYRFVESHLIARKKLPNRVNLTTDNGGALQYGLASGLMGATLAMPGPMALIFLRKNGFNPEQVKATVFALMVASYSAMLILSAAVSGVSDAAWLGLGMYLVPTSLGLLTGFIISKYIPDFLFDLLNTCLMLSAILVLGINIVGIKF